MTSACFNYEEVIVSRCLYRKYFMICISNQCPTLQRFTIYSNLGRLYYLHKEYITIPVAASCEGLFVMLLWELMCS